MRKFRLFQLLKSAAAMLAVLLFLCIQISAVDYTDRSTGASLDITAAGAILVDMDTGSILYRKNINEQCRPASLTKMMTLLVAYENTKDRQQEYITVTAEMINVPDGSSNAGLAVGDRITIHDLFYAMMLPSGNDAAKTLSFAVSGGEAAFVELMNAKAQEIGMKDTRYANTHGFDETGHYTTTHDLARLAYTISNMPELVEIFSSYRYTAVIYREAEQLTEKDDPATGKAEIMFYNTNNMINPNRAEYFSGLRGIKTGYTQLAGNCLASYYESGGRRLIAIVTNDQQARRDADTKTLINYGLNNFDTFDLVEVFGAKTYIVDAENADMGDESNGQLTLYLEDAPEPKFITVSKSDGTKIRALQDVVTVRKPAVRAPVFSGDYVGDIEFVYNGQIIYAARALASRDIDADIVSPADLVSLGIKGKIRVSFGFLTERYFLIPALSILSLVVLVFAFIVLRRRQATRVRARQKNVLGRGQKRRKPGDRPGNRTML